MRGVSYSMSAVRAQLDRARLISRPSFFAFGLLFLLVVVGMLLVMRSSPMVEGVEPLLSVVHITGNAAARHQLAVFTFRDNAYIKTDETVGFLSLSSACKQSAKEPLPAGLSLKRVMSLVSTDAFKNVGRSEANSVDLWLVRMHDGRTDRCVAVSNDEAKKNPDFVPLLRWFDGVQAAGAPLRAADCGGDPDVVYHWCEPRN
jgi:hypothetical protein